MLSGVSTAVKYVDGRTLVVGSEPTGEPEQLGRIASLIASSRHDREPECLSSLCHISRRQRLQVVSVQGPKPAINPPPTICYGLLTSLLQRTLAHFEQQVDFISTALDSAVLWTISIVAEKMKQLIEPSSANGVAVLLDKSDL